MINNRGQVASTFTWFAGFLVIFFIMFLFLIASLGIAAQKKVSGKLGSVDITGKESSLILNEKIIAFWEYEKTKNADIIGNFETTFKQDFEKLVPEATVYFFCYIDESGNEKNFFNTVNDKEITPVVPSAFNCKSGYVASPRFIFSYKSSQIKLWIDDTPIYNKYTGYPTGV